MYHNSVVATVRDLYYTFFTHAGACDIPTNFNNVNASRLNDSQSFTLLSASSLQL